MTPPELTEAQRAIVREVLRTPPPELITMRVIAGSVRELRTPIEVAMAAERA